MNKNFGNDNFDDIYWHDSELISIYFDQTDGNNILLLVDIVLESHPNNTLSSIKGYTLIKQPALVKFLNVSEAKFNLNFESGRIIEPTLAFMTRRKSNFLNKIDETVFYDYLIEFRNEGNIKLKIVTDFEMKMLGNPIVHLSEDDYLFKRNEILKNNFDIIWNF
ncbi:MAG: hypothetical protein KDD00_13220 [Ignavibacteriae bacterium]|nr:hypothetical protein [Ignavibacteriota bacterium]